MILTHELILRKLGCKKKQKVQAQLKSVGILKPVEYEDDVFSTEMTFKVYFKEKDIVELEQ